MDLKGETLSFESSSNIALETIRIGLLATALLFFQSAVLDSDGFIVGKALILTVAGLCGFVALAVAHRDYRVDSVDWLLLMFLAVACASSLGASNGWNATVALAGLGSSVLLFWTSRSVSIPRYRSALLISVLGALGIVIASALIEVYTPLQFSTRPPGGAIGNRNRMAHLVVIGFPALALLITRVRDRWMLGILLAGGALAGSALVLSRSRGAWVAFLAVVLAAVALRAFARATVKNSSRGSRTIRRLTFLGSAVSGGVLAALLIPNHLTWTSGTPYRDSAVTLLEYRSGTGAGRLTEYRNTLKMITAHPTLGVGPGNWRIAYPNYATPGDPNIEPGYVPVRRYPQGEWIGIAAERGVTSLLLVFLVAGIFAWRWGRAIVQEVSHRRAGYAYVGLLTMIAVFMVGLFDPVIMTPTAGLVVPVLLGVCAAPFANPRFWTPTPSLRMAMVSIVVFAGLILVSFPARELWAAMTYAKSPTLEAFQRAPRIADGDYRAHYFAASILVRRGDCSDATPYIEAARRLYPTAPAALNLEERCANTTGTASSESDGTAAPAPDGTNR